MLRTTRLALTAATLAVLVTAAPADAKRQGVTTWKVTEATHTSSATHTTDRGSASSSMRWRLAKPKPTAPNTVTIGAPGPLTSGYGVVNVFGDVVSDSKTDKGSCHLAADSSSDEHGYDVPWPITINLHPPKGGRMEVGLAAHYAKLGSGYFESECSIGSSLSPELEKQRKIITIPASRIRGKKIVLRWKGSGGDEGTYTWDTRIVLKRIKG